MIAPVVCPADGKGDGVQKVTALIGVASDELRLRLARPEVPPRPETGAGQTEVDWAPKVGEAISDTSALEQWEQRARQIGQVQQLWDTRLYYCHQHDIVFLDDGVRGAPPEEMLSFLIEKASVQQQPTSPTPSTLVAERAPTEPAPDSADQADQWEYCEIILQRGFLTLKYVAQAVGPTGLYIAASSPGVTALQANENPMYKHGAAVSEVVRQLLTIGWEPLNVNGLYWFSQRFRRRISQVRYQAPGQLAPQQWSVAANQISRIFSQPGSVTQDLSSFAPLASAWLNQTARAVKDIARATLGSTAQPGIQPPTYGPNAPPSYAAGTRPIILGPATDTEMSPAPSVSSGYGPTIEENSTTIFTQPTSSYDSVEAGFPSQQPLAKDLLDRIGAGVHYLAADHMAHEDLRQRAAMGILVDEDGSEQVDAVMVTMQTFGSRAYAALVTGVEMVPGIGDVATGIEALLGRTFDGLYLSLLERMFYIVLAFIPIVPARPVVAVYRKYEPWLRPVDTTTQRARTGQLLAKGSGLAATTGWYFLISQLPFGLARHIPDLDDSAYPRPFPFQAGRKIVEFIWLPLFLYFGVVAGEISREVYERVSQDADWQVVPGKVGEVLSAAFAGALLVGAVFFIGALVISQFAHRDRLRETFLFLVRGNVPVAHATLVQGVNDTVWQQDLSLRGKLTRSYQHLHDVSLGTAKSIIKGLLKREALHLFVAIVLAIAAVAAGVALALSGVI
ncbi:MAG TPA: hypothetical protein VH349_10845 [Ktedonobacterales bacterium]|jgi:hypothetical protein